jgi:hypothetical protein
MMQIYNPMIKGCILYLLLSRGWHKTVGADDQDLEAGFLKGK